ncbi:MAG: NADH-quinone oxidoreductase subunit F [Betaproteobacteria bacterium]|nr:NADH-quinone oxidoreductase subunit F [Betaproteobacteria bacterium]
MNGNQPDKPAPRRNRVRSTIKGRSVDTAALADVRALLDGAEPPANPAASTAENTVAAHDVRRRDMLIENLHRIQDRYGRLSAAHLVALAAEMKLSMAEVYEVATFYHHFDVEKDGGVKDGVEKDGAGNVGGAGESSTASLPALPVLTVRVCDSLSCEMAGARELLARLPAALGGGKFGREIRVLHAPCVGRCESAPCVVVGQNPVLNASVEAVTEAVKAGNTRSAEPAYLDYTDYRKAGGYALLAGCHAGGHSAESLIKVMEDSALRGLGGAGFPVGRKWRSVAAEPAPRLMAVNIDEGEPGTFKDRWYLERDPHRFLEGMLVAAWCVGIPEIYIYLRDEYAGCRAVLERELARLRADPPCDLPTIHLRRGAGAYICGEESAMIESIEGKRGMPRLRPPYVAQVGLFGRPTLEHNMETLYWVREIVERGAGWFADQGRHGRKGLRSFSVSGRVRKPGMHLAPAGITAAELIAEYCGGMQDGHTFYGYLPGGASGGILPASMADIPLDFDTLNAYGCFIGSAAVIVLSEHDRAVDAARNLTRFFSEESCGQCTPCRVGTVKALQLLEAPRWDQPLLRELSQAMMDASICGLGQAAPNPLLSVMKYFPREIE